MLDLAGKPSISAGCARHLPSAVDENTEIARPGVSAPIGELLDGEDLVPSENETLGNSHSPPFLVSFLE
ncbi:hypothetical protein [Mesorhizobium sp. B2-3-10]|uniref:hypothetical protein n=1 Tax=Mesorhizobium sp. B2-3-10 TaxID=2589954 RepID=UPI00112DDBE7|nr:hypothetical protein [Mesorhizobium sp. B2-3-10]TPM00761.1 hypothetical protein FJ943_11310 [Mesorhizobium sp. B2-3-10]